MTDQPTPDPHATITEFLLARIAEDEAQAQEAADLTEPVYGHFGHDGSSGTLDLAEQEGAPEECIASFARWQPARVLAECAAKRRIIEAHATQREDDDPSAWIVASKTLLRALAAIYADHPDYDEAWR